MLLSSLAAREPQLSPYAREQARRRSRWSPAVRGPGWSCARPRSTAPATARRWPISRLPPEALRRRPCLADARLSLIHVADLAEALALAVGQPLRHRSTKSMTARQAATAIGDMAVPPPRPWAEASGRWPSRACSWKSSPGPTSSAIHWAGPCKFSRPARSSEIFHSDWTVHDRRLAAAIALRPRYDLASGFRRHGLVVSPPRMAIDAGETLRNKLSFHKESLFLPEQRCLTPGIGETRLRTAHELTVENDGMARHDQLCRCRFRAPT